jgi:translation initiation factor 3 subunit E
MTKLTNDSLQLTLDQINALYRYGYFQYSCGNYGEASSYLYHFRVLSTDPVLTVSSHWGKLASDILTGDWDRALEELKLLRDFIDTSRPDEGGHEAVLQKRTWLLHWSLFVWFNHPEGREGLVEMFFSTPYLNTIQTTCWWLLRYLVTSLIITRRSSRVYVIQTPLNASNPGAPATTKLTPTAALQDITRILTQESHRIGDDPILKFVQELYCNFNFDAAQQELKRAQEVCSIFGQ